MFICLLCDVVVIDFFSVVYKLLYEGCGGYCYEFNGLFLVLL